MGGGTLTIVPLISWSERGRRKKGDRSSCAAVLRSFREAIPKAFVEPLLLHDDDDRCLDALRASTKALLKRR